MEPVSHQANVKVKEGLQVETAQPGKEIVEIFTEFIFILTIKHSLIGFWFEVL
jgi:hypothetical protein